MAAEKKIVIIGAGPCGLGSGWALSDRGHDDWVILEKNNYAGGLSASFRNPAKAVGRKTSMNGSISPSGRG